tara:strand:+ start:23037 stop:23789 length:753 start_codon:yes stop_codon:yes gene_type:complete
MNIVACVKRVPSTEALAVLGGDGKSLNTSDMLFGLSFYDDIALEGALNLKESKGGEVTALSIGSAGGTKEMRECLAKGADKAIILTDEHWMERDCRSTAKVLAAQLTSMGADVAFMGRVATDRDNAAVGPMVATYLGWACVTDVVELEMGDGKGTAKRETEHGVETIEFSLPAVITCDKGLYEPRKAGMKGVMGAKKKPLDEVAFEDVPNQAQITSVTLPPPRPEGRIVGEGAAAVPALIEALQNETQVL